MAITTFKRFENKYLISGEQYKALMPYIAEHMNPDKYCVGDKEYKICNIYFDTPTNDVIRHSSSKPYYKEKLRLRSYSTPQSGDTTVFLELKKKIGGIVAKRRAVMTLSQAKSFIESGNRPQTDNYMTNQVLDELTYYMQVNCIAPAVYISYDRKAFFAKDNPDFRLTIDRNIITRRDDLRLECGCYGSQLLEPDTFLMEIKICGAVPLWLAQALSELKIYKTSFSKYGREYGNYVYQHVFGTDDIQKKIV